MCIPQVLRAGCSPFNHLDLSNCNKEKCSSKTAIPPSETRDATLKPTPLPYEIFEQWSQVHIMSTISTYILYQTYLSI